MDMLYVIIGLFALGAIIGMYLLMLVMQDRTTPKPVAFVHGLFVVIAFILLIMYTTQHIIKPTESVVLFSMAALGGALLIYKDLTGKKIPKWLAIAHGLIAVAGFIFLLVFAFKN